MTGTGDEALEEDDRVPERARGLGLGALEGELELVGRSHHPDAPATATAPGLEHQRVPDRLRPPLGVLQARHRTPAPRGHRDAGRLCEKLGLDLVPQAAHRLGRRSDEHQPQALAEIGEVGVLRHESPADPYGVGTAEPQRPLELRVVGVRAARRAHVAKAHRLVGQADEEGSLLGLGVERDDLDAVAVLLVQLPNGSDEPYRRLTPVDHHDPTEHESPWYGLGT